MMLADYLWLCTAAYALHIIEEFTFDWRNWARKVLGLAVDWPQFYVVNAVVIVLGIVASELAPDAPAIALAYPALMLINATFFHVLPFITARGRFSPGLATAVALFYPLGIASYAHAGAEGTLSAAAIILSGMIGAALMAAPVVLVKLKDRPYFRQDR